MCAYFRGCNDQVQDQYLSAYLNKEAGNASENNATNGNTGLGQNNDGTQKITCCLYMMDSREELCAEVGGPLVQEVTMFRD